MTASNHCPTITLFVNYSQTIVQKDDAVTYALTELGLSQDYNLIRLLELFEHLSYVKCER